MVTFGYRKLYADLVTPDGWVCIVYVAQLNIMAVEQPSAGYELYAPDGERTVVHATGPARIEVGHGSVCVGFPTRDGHFELTCLARDEPAAMEHTPVRGLTWRVVVHRGSAHARVLAPGLAALVLAGSGYADEVALGRPPRALGLRRIRWGRVHLGDSSLVFNHVVLRGGKTWQAASDGTTWSAEVELVDTPLGLVAVRHRASRLTFKPGRMLHEGVAIDRARFPGRLSRGLARVLGGPIEEQRRLSSVEDERGIEGMSLYEDVRLG